MTAKNTNVAFAKTTKLKSQGKNFVLPLTIKQFWNGYEIGFYNLQGVRKCDVLKVSEVISAVLNAESS
jgi:hypothetical protein